MGGVMELSSGQQLRSSTVLISFRIRVLLSMRIILKVPDSIG